MLKIFFTVILVLTSLSFYSQNRQDLEKRKNSILEEINYANKLIADLSKSSKQSKSTIFILNKKILLRQELIANIKSEMNIIDYKIAEQTEIVQKLKDDISNLKKEYGLLIYSQYKTNNNILKIAFILSADDFNTAKKRFVYLRQMGDYRMRQVEMIKKAYLNLEKYVYELNQTKIIKNSTLKEHQDEVAKLEKEIVQMKSMVKELNKKKSALEKQVKQQSEIAEQINQQIKKMIAEEARKAFEERKKKNISISSGKIYNLSPDEEIISTDFEKNKNKLPWPLKQGIITSNFGEQPHPILKGVVIRNDGIDITTENNAEVRSIFNGEVSRVFVIPGANKTIIIRHGNYLSVYSNLVEIYVKPGDKVSIKQIIGKLGNDNDNEQAYLKFQLWHENIKLDPNLWLAK